MIDTMRRYVFITLMNELLKRLKKEEKRYEKTGNYQRIRTKKS